MNKERAIEKAIELARENDYPFTIINTLALPLDEVRKDPSLKGGWWVNLVFDKSEAGLEKLIDDYDALVKIYPDGSATFRGYM